MKNYVKEVRKYCKIPERFRTALAFVGSQTEMNAIVNLKTLFVAGPETFHVQLSGGGEREREGFKDVRYTLVVTHVALMHLRLIASVNQLVNVDVLLLEEALAAHVTLEVALVAMEHDVLLQVFLPLERLVADVATEVALVAVRFAYVRVAMCRLRKLATTKLAPGE